MKDNLDNVLSNFLNNDKKEDNKNNNNNTEMISPKDGLIERIEKTYITSDGKILLKD